MHTIFKTFVIHQIQSKPYETVKRQIKNASKSLHERHVNDCGLKLKNKRGELTMR